MPSTDPLFRQQYLEAVVCLAHLQDPELVVTVLRRAGSGVHPLHQLDLLRVLVAMDGRAIPALGEALGSGEQGVRRSAALALLYLDRKDATRLLLEAVDSGEPRRVEAASFVLRELIAVGHLPPDRAFESIQRLLQSIDPEVRANAVLSLEMFDPSRPVMRLLDEADDDGDAVVRRAAASTRKALREAARMRYLGRPGAPGG
jgi:HEAT repeat protein